MWWTTSSVMIVISAATNNYYIVQDSMRTMCFEIKTDTKVASDCF